jgi:hypothetical protein
MHVFYLHSQRRPGMDLLSGVTGKEETQDFWTEIEQCYPAEEIIPLEIFRQKMLKALNDLGRLDYDFNAALGGLRSGESSEIPDQLHAQVSDIAQADISKAMAELVTAVTNAKELASELVADEPRRLRQ